MSNRKRHGEMNRRILRHPAVLVAATGLALGLSTTADAVTRTRLSSRIQTLSQFGGSLSSQGSSVVVANMDIGHVWETHQAFGDRVNRIWWPVNFPFIGPDFTQFMPPGSNGEIGVARGLFFTAHATAAASALAGNWQVIPNAGPSVAFRSVIGFAPGADMILSGGFGGGTTSEGVLLGDDGIALAFTILALTDPKVAGFAANLLDIPEYEVATVVNASFGSTANARGRLGESIDAHAFDVAVVRNDPIIVAAVGDNNQNPALQEQLMMMGDPGGTVASPASGYNTLRVSRLGEGGNTVDDAAGVGPLGFSNYAQTQGLLLSSIPPIDFPMGCMPAFQGPDMLPGSRSGPHLTAPGTLLTLAGSPILDPPSVAPEAADTAFATLWEGTSFASAIVAGTAAMIQDIGNKNNLWPADLEGVVKPSGLATRAILLTAVNPSMTPNIQNTGGATGSLEEDACIFTQSADDEEGVGQVWPPRIRELLLPREADGSDNHQAADVRPGRPMIVDQIERPLQGFTRAGFDQSIPYDDQRYRPDPPTPPWMDILGNSVTVEFIVNNTLPIPPSGTQQGEVTGESFGWFDGWRTNLAVPIEGTDLNTPFVTTILPAQDPEPMMATAPSASPAAPATPGIVTENPSDDGASMDEPPARFEPFGQPSVEPPPDPDLNNDRFDLGGPGGLQPLPPPTAGPGGGGGGGSGSFLPVKKGWDVGRIGAGFIDYPLGVITPESTIRASLVWNRTEIWSETDIDSLAAPVGFKEMTLNQTQVRISRPPFIDPGFPFPQPFISENTLLPNYQEAFAFENLDLELWRVNPAGGQNILIGASRGMSDTFEHISVGADGACQPSDFSEIVFAQYFLRVKYTDTVYDFGGYRHCGDFQTLQLLRPGSANDNSRYRNLWPSEVPFAVAWIADLSPSPELNAMQFISEPIDMNGDGRIDDADINLMIMAGMGDLNTDGVINATDLSILMSKYGTDDPIYDLNHDGTVNGADIALMLSRFGETPTP